MKILSEISAGELLDKISILEIKIKKIKDQNKKNQATKEYEILKKIQSSSIEINEDLKKLYESLKKINTALWDIEDKIRVCEKNANFGNQFVELARSVYINNDKRFGIKLEINKKLNSDLVEVKEYVDYKKPI